MLNFFHYSIMIAKINDAKIPTRPPYMTFFHRYGVSSRHMDLIASAIQEKPTPTSEPKKNALKNVSNDPIATSWKMAKNAAKTAKVMLK